MNKKCFWKITADKEKQKKYKSPLVKYSYPECNKCNGYDKKCVKYSTGI